MSRVRRTLGWIAMLVALAGPLASAQDLPTVYSGPSSPNAEFDAVSAIRVLPGGDVAEISGSFSVTVPQTFADLLAQAPSVRTVRFESPGGHVKAALAVAEIIRAHRLDTYVGRICASACTLAFLAGRHRYLAPGARLGFHQATVPGARPDRFDPVLRATYAKFNVPADFIDHVLRTPPQAIWYPDRDELRDAGFVTDPPPASVTVTDDPVSAAWFESAKQLRWASDDTLERVAAALTALLAQLQTRGGDVCWGFMHGVPTDLPSMIDLRTAQAMAASLQQVRDDVTHTPAVGIDHAERVRLLAALTGSLTSARQRDALQALQPDGVHGPYCGSMRMLLNTALALPPPGRGATLRALLSIE